MGHYFHASLPGSVLHVDPCAGHVATFKRRAIEIFREFNGGASPIEAP
jgi:hypothetical protein